MSEKSFHFDEHENLASSSQGAIIEETVETFVNRSTLGNNLGRKGASLENRKRQKELREKAIALSRARMKQWEIARELGISQQRVSQLLQEEPKGSFSGDRTTGPLYASRITEALLTAVARGGVINARETQRGIFKRLELIGVLRRSTIPRYYTLTDKAIAKLGSERQFNFIRFCLFDVLHFDRLDAEEFDSELLEIKQMWKRRTSTDHFK